MPTAVAFWATAPASVRGRQQRRAAEKAARRTDYSVRFTKLDAARYLSHLDLVRLMERAVRRSELPVSFTAGFNPRPRMALIAALPVGVESDDELLTLRLDEPLAPGAVRDRLNGQLVLGVRVTRVEVGSPPAGGEMRAKYEIDLPDGVVVEQIEAERLMARPEVPVELKTGKGSKTVDLRPFLLDLTAKYGKMSYSAKVTPRGTARPDAVLTALLGAACTEQGGFRIRRTSLECVHQVAPKPHRDSAQARDRNASDEKK